LTKLPVGDTYPIEFILHHFWLLKIAIKGEFMTTGKYLTTLTFLVTLLSLNQAISSDWDSITSGIANVCANEEDYYKFEEICNHNGERPLSVQDHPERGLLSEKVESVSLSSLNVDSINTLKKQNAPLVLIQFASELPQILKKAIEAGEAHLKKSNLDADRISYYESELLKWKLVKQEYENTRLGYLATNTDVCWGSSTMVQSGSKITVCKIDETASVSKQQILTDLIYSLVQVVESKHYPIAYQEISRRSECRVEKTAVLIVKAATGQPGAVMSLIKS
jgi:hypothetical protein